MLLLLLEDALLLTPIRLRERWNGSVLIVWLSMPDSERWNGSVLMVWLSMPDSEERDRLSLFTGPPGGGPGGGGGFTVGGGGIGFTEGGGPATPVPGSGGGRFRVNGGALL